MANKRMVLDGSQAALVTAVLEHEQRVLAELRQYIALRLAPIRTEHQIADGVQVRFGLDGDKAIMEIVEPDPAPRNGNGANMAVVPPGIRQRGRKRTAPL